MATRFYLPTTGSPDITPAYDDSWDKTSDADRLKMVFTKISSSFATSQTSENSASQWYKSLYRQYVSPPINAHTFTTSETIKFYARAMESDGQANFYHGLVVRIHQPDGSVRGVIFDCEYGGGNNLTGVEYDSKTLTNNGASETVQVEVSALDGDYISVEIGIVANQIKTDSYTATIDFGDNSGTDLPEDTSTESQYNPWFELSPDLTEYSGVPYVPQIIMVT